MAVRTDFTAGEVLAAADLNDTFASKVDYALPTNAQAGTAYTFVAADAEKLTTASNGSAVTLTIPPQSSVTWSDNTVLRVVNYGAGAVTIDGGSGVTVTNTSSTVAQYGAAVAIRTGSDAWTVVPFGGGDVPSATVSSPAATGQYTDGGGQTWDYYTFTSSGTLTVDTAGFADVLVVGGGGGASYAGGGAGGYLDVTSHYLAAGTHSVTVGAGGSGGTNAIAGTGSGVGSVIAAGGGGSVERNGSGTQGSAGASGGGGGTAVGIGGIALALSQGNAGGGGAAGASGGGGGASAVGSTATANTGGNGGGGSASAITGSSVTRAGGGGGSGGTTQGSGGAGGGANAAASASNNGTANTGGGGGGRADTGVGGNGGSGIVIVRVKV